MKKDLTILGIRGIPASHGGFETFAENLAIFLVDREWQVTVYCQDAGWGLAHTSTWCDIKRIHIPAGNLGAFSTIIFDLLAVLHSIRSRSLFLTLGYNTAIFNTLHRIFRRVGIINMDGIEWQREKWGALAKLWFWINERVACRVGHSLIADNPGIEEHLATRAAREKITMIPYGARYVESADVGIIERFGLSADEYAIVIARPEPENSILEIVNAFSKENRGIKLAVLGSFDPQNNQYHKAVVDASSKEVLFLGAVYDPQKVDSLRYHARCYIHGHKVGGTNPSLVEALGCGSPVVAYDNIFNRWVAKDAALYFGCEQDLSETLNFLLSDRKQLKKLKVAARQNFRENFQWQVVLAKYEELLGVHL